MTHVRDVVVIGGGQSALACAYFLRRTTLNYLLLDNQKQCGAPGSMAGIRLPCFLRLNIIFCPDGLCPNLKIPFLPGMKSLIIDAVIWCTGFGYATDHLRDLVSGDENGKIATEGTRAKETEGLWLVGYGSWTGFASATMIGVGRTAKQTVKEVEGLIKGS